MDERQQQRQRRQRRQHHFLSSPYGSIRVSFPRALGTAVVRSVSYACLCRYVYVVKSHYGGKVWLTLLNRSRYRQPDSNFLSYIPSFVRSLDRSSDRSLDRSWTVIWTVPWHEPEPNQASRRDRSRVWYRGAREGRRYRGRPSPDQRRGHLRHRGGRPPRVSRFTHSIRFVQQHSVESVSQSVDSYNIHSIRAIFSRFV